MTILSASPANNYAKLQVIAESITLTYDSLPNKNPEIMKVNTNARVPYRVLPLNSLNLPNFLPIIAAFASEAIIHKTACGSTRHKVYDRTRELMRKRWVNQKKGYLLMLNVSIQENRDTINN